MSDPAKSHAEHAHHYGERAATVVLVITLATMVVEIVAGWWTGSMALTADGWHMGMHAVAMGVAVLAYRYARRHRTTGRYSFGAAKAVDLGGFANAVMLAVVALLVALESAERLLKPERIEFGPALTVAAIGLAVNLLSAWLLHGGHDHNHDYDHGHHHDHNREAAFIHVLADAFTSALAIAALFCGRHFGLVWLDPLVGMIGAAVILNWSMGLAKRTSAVLLDAAPEEAVLQRARAIVDEHGDDLLELRAWPIAAGRFGLALRVATRDRPDYSPLLLALPGIAYVLVEQRRSPPPVPIDMDSDIHHHPAARHHHHH